MAISRIMSTTPLVCGHDFVAEVKPRASERLWCWTCFDYRHVSAEQKPADPAPAPRPVKPTKPKAELRVGTDTHCANGHERTPENTYQRPSGGSLVCRVCRSQRPRRRRQRQKV